MNENEESTVRRVDCPFCDVVCIALDDDEVFNVLKEHLEDDHGGTVRMI